MTARYESPDVNIELTNEDIHRRYQDTAMVIFKVSISITNRSTLNLIMYFWNFFVFFRTYREKRKYRIT